MLSGNCWGQREMFTYSYSFYNLRNQPTVLWESLAITPPDNSSPRKVSIYVSKTADLAIFSQLIGLVGLTNERNRLDSELENDFRQWRKSKSQCCGCLGGGGVYPGPDFTAATRLVHVNEQIAEIMFTLFRLDAHYPRDSNVRTPGTPWDLFVTQVENAVVVTKRQMELARVEHLKQENRQFNEPAADFIVTRVVTQLKGVHALSDSIVTPISVKIKRFLLEKSAFENFNNIMRDEYYQDRVNLANRILETCVRFHSTQEVFDLQLEDVIIIWKSECLTRIQQESRQHETEQLLRQQSNQIKQLAFKVDRRPTSSPQPQGSTSGNVAKAVGTAAGKELGSLVVQSLVGGRL